MIKKVYIYLLLPILSGGLIFGLFNVKISGNKVTHDEVLGHSTEAEGPTDTVKSFWKYSLEGNQKAVRDLLTSMPPSFSDKQPRCRNNDEITSTNLTNSSWSNVVSPAKPKENDEWTKNSLEMSSFIGDSKYELVGASNKSVYEQESIVKVKFNHNNINSSLYFLLYQENAEWKIFAITDGYAVLNPNYANGKCD